MPAWLVLVTLAGPAALVLVRLFAFYASGPRPASVLATTRIAAWLTVLGAAMGAGAVIAGGAMTSPVLGGDGLGFALRLDALSAVMSLLVALLGLVVLRFSTTYLDGEARQGRFLGRLAVTLAAVLLLVLAGNLVQLAAAWVGMSLALHGLLRFYPDRPRAESAARKKFMAARLGDGCLVVAVVLLSASYGTGDIATIIERAAAGVGAGHAGVILAAVLIAVAALLKCAQLPAHGWLLEVMETPTPVSALLHAGMINAGGFLVVRLADVMVLVPGALHALALAGAVSAVVAGAVMLTQSTVKIALAWSTIAQMGFMLLQCGLGAFHLAVLHIVAHGLYKAHAFLASGSVVDGLRAGKLQAQLRTPSLTRALLTVPLALAVVAVVTTLAGLTLAAEPGVIALTAIFALGVAHLAAQAAAERPLGQVLAWTGLASAGLATAYVLLHRGAGMLLGAAVPEPLPASPIGLAVTGFAVALFAAAITVQPFAPRLATTPRGRRLYVHLANGLYVNALYDRIAGSLAHGGRQHS